jgi:hypothetical protein
MPVKMGVSPSKLLTKKSPIMPQKLDIITRLPSFHKICLQQTDCVMAQQHPKGATYTEQFGDMRTHGTGGAAKQRASNTRLEDASVLHDHPAAARNDEFDGMEWAIQESLRQQQLLEETTTMQTCPFGVALSDRNEMSAFTTAPVASASVNAFTPVAITTLKMRCHRASQRHERRQ